MPPLSGKPACGYLEYLSRIVGAGKVQRQDKESRIPGFEEI